MNIEHRTSNIERRILKEEYQTYGLEKWKNELRFTLLE